MRISWLKIEPKVSIFPTVIEILLSISITKAKKATFWYALFLTVLTFCSKNERNGNSVFITKTNLFMIEEKILSLRRLCPSLKSNILFLIPLKNVI